MEGNTVNYICGRRALCSARPPTAHARLLSRRCESIDRYGIAVPVPASNGSALLGGLVTATLRRAESLNGAAVWRSPPRPSARRPDARRVLNLNPIHLKNIRFWDFVPKNCVFGHSPVGECALRAPSRVPKQIFWAEGGASYLNLPNRNRGSATKSH